MTQTKRLVVQIRSDQWQWLQDQTETLHPVSSIVRNLIDAAMIKAKCEPHTDVGVI
jgi:hypothetical protein